MKSTALLVLVLVLVASSVAVVGACDAPNERALDRFAVHTRGAPRDASSVAVLPRKAALEEKGSYPCSECHDDSLPNDPRERVLTEAHEDIKLVHGAGRMWCTTCHHEDRGQLKSLKGAPIDFDQSYLLCGECHFRQQQDSFAGAHGKRVGNWNAPEPNVVVACTGCHDAHDPSIKSRLPWRRGKRAPHEQP